MGFSILKVCLGETKRKRPDMRTHGRGSDKGIPIVLLTIDVPEEQVLLSDFDWWHVVLNKGEIIFPLENDMVHSAEECRKSWEKIFDYECTFDEERRTELFTQATMREVKLEWIRKVEYFAVR